MKSKVKKFEAKKVNENLMVVDLYAEKKDTVTVNTCSVQNKDC